MNAVRIHTAAAIQARVIPLAGATPVWMHYVPPVRARRPLRHYFGVTVRTGIVYRELQRKNRIPVAACRVPYIPRDHPEGDGPGCVA
ncbi:MAG: hypothetical protein CVV30_06395 [Methanomicrobiales archaeon HGW-Methanomicrobiales-1]|jgi:hypothetical protein|nr:MAG: hypothetical protein CVV30_06395 [Methanomicrobiales archaeon HGW-Methanomicrobiales-1]